MAASAVADPAVVLATAGPEEEFRRAEVFQEQDRQRAELRRVHHRAMTEPGEFPDWVHLSGRTSPLMSCLPGRWDRLRSGSLEKLVFILSGPLAENGAQPVRCSGLRQDLPPASRHPRSETRGINALDEGEKLRLMARMIFREERQPCKSGWFRCEIGCPQNAFAQCIEHLFGVAGSQSSDLRFDGARRQFSAAE